MSNIPPEDPAFVKEKIPKPELSERPLNSVEETVNELGKTLVNVAKIETKVTEVTKTTRASTPEERAKLDHPEVAMVAVKGVRDDLNKTPSLSIHNKWASPKFKEYFTTLEDVTESIAAARSFVESIKKMYRDVKIESLSQMQTEVNTLLEKGGITPVSGGKGGVYFLHDQEGNPKYVIKPGDESLLAINNGKNYASPFLNTKEVGPVSGVYIYEAVQNAELAYKAAEILGFTDITPRTEVMIIEYSGFHDILDGTSEKNIPDMQKMEKVIPTTKEKVCTVQPFLEGYWDIGSHLAEQSKLEPAQIRQLMRDDPDAYDRLEEEYSPRDIDPLQYEKIAIFSLIIGESDGNAGNLMCSKENPVENNRRPIKKIDNAASFPENNKNLRTGLNWVIHNYRVEFSPNVKEIVRKIDHSQIDQLKLLMKERGKSKESIQALENRIIYLKEEVENALTIEELNFAIKNREEE